MKIGAMSDTHGDNRALERAFRLLEREGAERIVHAGDIGRSGLSFLGFLAGEAGIPAYVALGNCDASLEEEIAYGPLAKTLAAGRTVSFEADGKRLSVCHGDDLCLLAGVATLSDAVFTGHAHVAGESRLGETRLLAPGSAARPRDGKPSCGLFDTATGAWRVFRMG